jgi:hypothetical protein
LVVALNRRSQGQEFRRVAYSFTPPVQPSDPEISSNAPELLISVRR